MKFLPSIGGLALLAAFVLLFDHGTSAQSGCQLVETLPNDQFIVRINGKEYRAINAEKVKDIAATKIDRDEARALLDVANQKLAAQQTALDTSERAVTACSDTATRMQTFLDHQAAYQQSVDTTLARMQLAQDKQAAAIDSAAELVRGGRVRQFMQNPWVDVSNRYLIQPALSGIWNRISGCK